MALFDDVLKSGNVVTGLAIGAAALLVMPFLRPIARPLAKAAIKGGILAYRETARLYNDSMSGMGEIAREAAEEVGAPEMPTANARRPLEPPPRAKSR